MSVQRRMGYRILADGPDPSMPWTISYIAEHGPGAESFWTMRLDSFLDSGDALLSSLLTTLKRAEIIKELWQAGHTVEEISRQVAVLAADDD